MGVVRGIVSTAVGKIRGQGRQKMEEGGGKGGSKKQKRCGPDYELYVHRERGRVNNVQEKWGNA